MNTSLEPQGRIEAFYNGQWGSICDEYWDNSDAMVACQQLGYGVGEYKYFYYADKGSRPFTLEKFNCRGDETSLIDCIHSNYSGSCYSNEEASVKCSQGRSHKYLDSSRC